MTENQSGHGEFLSSKNEMRTWMKRPPMESRHFIRGGGARCAEEFDRVVQAQRTGNKRRLFDFFRWNVAL